MRRRARLRREPRRSRRAASCRHGDFIGRLDQAAGARPPNARAPRPMPLDRRLYRTARIRVDQAGAAQSAQLSHDSACSNSAIICGCTEPISGSWTGVCWRSTRRRMSSRRSRREPTPPRSTRRGFERGRRGRPAPARKIFRDRRPVASSPSGYDAILCDVWGVLIDGAQAFSGRRRGAAGVSRARRDGRADHQRLAPERGSAAPARRSRAAAAIAYDDLVSAGELTLREIVARKGAGLLSSRAAARHGSVRGRADACSARRCGWSARTTPITSSAPGLIDERPRNARGLRRAARSAAARAISTMLCANPDIVVDVGDRSRLVRRRAGANATRRSAARS